MLGGSRVLDLCAGTGAVAIEALSRGAESAVMIEQSNRSLAVIRRNLAALGLEPRGRVIRGDSARVIPKLASGEPFDLVFLDPPYDSDRLVPALEALASSGVLARGATVVVETAKRHSLAAVPGLVVRDERTYGDTRLTWLEPSGEADPETE